MIALSSHLKEQAHQAYLAGKRVTDIARELGIDRSTLAQWSSRHDWPQQRQQITERTIQAFTQKAVDVTEDAILRHQEQIYGAVDGQLDTLANFEPKNSKELLLQAKALKELDDVARRNLGIDDSAINPPKQTINLNLGTLDPKPYIEVATECSQPSTVAKILSPSITT